MERVRERVTDTSNRVNHTNNIHPSISVDHTNVHPSTDLKKMTYLSHREGLPG